MTPMVLREFERLFCYFNKKLFAENLILPVFRFDPKKHFGFRFQGQIKQHEFVIGMGLVDSDWLGLVNLFIHEMIHMNNYVHRINDHTVNQYHNQFFANGATRLGFYVLKHPSRGWSQIQLNGAGDGEILSPSKIDHDYLKKVIHLADFDGEIMRTILQQMKEVQSRPKKQFQLKYICRCSPPHNTVRSGRRPTGKNPLRVRCEICGYTFLPEKASDFSV